MLMKMGAAVAVALLALLGAHPAPAADRVALVIGTSAYKHSPALSNPKNDAADVVASLRKLEFDVVQGIDLDRAGMETALRNFTAKLAGAKLSVFFYAGHGLQVDNVNYLSRSTPRSTARATSMSRRSASITCCGRWMPGSA